MKEGRGEEKNEEEKVRERESYISDCVVAVLLLQQKQSCNNKQEAHGENSFTFFNKHYFIIIITCTF